MAQEQAVKMALLNKISNSIRKYIDLSDIINSAFSEFSEFFGAFKIYYAVKHGADFKIEQINKDFINEKNSIIKFDEKSLKDIKSNKITSSVCLKEHLESETFKTSVCQAFERFLVTEVLFLGGNVKKIIKPLTITICSTFFGGLAGQFVATRSPSFSTIQVCLVIILFLLCTLY